MHRTVLDPVRNTADALALSATLTDFLDRSPCPFAQRARICQAGPWTSPDPTPGRLDALAHYMRRLVGDDRCDLAVLEIHSAGRLASVAHGSKILLALLAGLRERDPLTELPLTAGIDDPNWDFEFCGEAFFVSLFAPYYPAAHSRYSGEPDIAFVLLQAERGFRRFGVSSQRPDRRGLSERVHRRFEGHGQPYDLGLNTAAPKAHRYVKPLHSGEPAVRWWEPYRGTTVPPTGSSEPR